MTPLVLLPGMMCDERLFGPQIEALGRHRDVVVGDIGRHDSLQRLADDVLDAAPPRFALAGLSMGGIVAMQCMAQAPDRIERLALLDTNPLAEADEVRKRRQRQIRDVTSGSLHTVMRDEMKPNYLADGEGKQAILELCMAMAHTLGPEVFVRQSLALRDRPDQQDTLRAVDVPALVLCGREDRACPIERHELMHRLMPHSQLTIVDAAGHLPVLEQPDITNAALRRWLEE